MLLRTSCSSIINLNVDILQWLRFFKFRVYSVLQNPHRDVPWVLSNFWNLPAQTALARNSGSYHCYNATSIWSTISNFILGVRPSQGTRPLCPNFENLPAQTALDIARNSGSYHCYLPVINNFKFLFFFRCSSESRHKRSKGIQVRSNMLI